jgi:hypothetical protein
MPVETKEPMTNIQKHKRYNIVAYVAAPQWAKKNRDDKPIRIGYAVETDKGIACTVTSLPLNWNGEFILLVNDREDS